MECRKQPPLHPFLRRSPIPVTLFAHIIGTVVITRIIGIITIITIGTGVTITGIIGSAGEAGSSLFFASEPSFPDRRVGANKSAT